MKRCSISYIIEEMQTKTIRYHYTPTRMARIWNADTTKCWQGCGAAGTLIHCWWEWMQNGAATLVVPHKTKHTLTIWFSNCALGIYPNDLKTAQKPVHGGFPGGAVVKNPPAKAGDRVQALVREDPTCRGATKPVHHNYWACALEPTSHNYWARVPQLLKPQA